jgi:hypothetical protein
MFLLVLRCKMMDSFLSVLRRKKLLKVARNVLKYCNVFPDPSDRDV